MKERYIIFLDESGMSEPKTFKTSPYFVISGFVINKKFRPQFNESFQILRNKYFKKGYILHNTDIRQNLLDQTKLSGFAKDFEKFLKSTPFFLLFVVHDKKEAIKRSWLKKTIIKRGYYEILGNLIKFLIAKNSSGEIHTEASNAEQDLAIYKDFNTLISYGIPDLGITHDDVKNSLTALKFVTKINDDAEEQIADLLGCMPKLKLEIDGGKKKLTDLDDLDKLLLSVMDNNKFGKAKPKDKNKTKLYSAINSFLILP